MKHSTWYRFRFLFPFVILGFIALFTFIVYEIWNGVLTDVTGVKAITYWQALGLLILAKILFGGFPCRGGGRCGPPWRRHMMDRCGDMTPEQREHFREEMRHRFGDWPKPWMGDEPKPSDQPPKA